MDILKSFIGFRTLKTVIGAAIAVYISQLLGLNYAVNSGIIVILSVQATKKKSLDLAIMRIGSTVLALTIGTIVFTIFGYTAVSFGIYLLFFIPAATRLKFNDGIVPCSVLVSHLVAVQSVAFPSLMNEMMQMLIGAGIGFVLNLYMPSFERKLELDKAEIERLFKEILLHMANCLRTNASALDHTLFDALEKKLKESNNRAWMEAENKLLKEVSHHVKYMEARITQFEILQHMRKYFKRMGGCEAHLNIAADITVLIANRFNKTVSLEEIVEAFKSYRSDFKKMPLPETREAFEKRATLYEYINDLEHLLEAKGAIMASLSENSVVLDNVPA